MMDIVLLLFWMVGVIFFGVVVVFSVRASLSESDEEKIRKTRDFRGGGVI